VRDITPWGSRGRKEVAERRTPSEDENRTTTGRRQHRGSCGRHDR
jgi:hypothetical protein